MLRVLGKLDQSMASNADRPLTSVLKASFCKRLVAGHAALLILKLMGVTSRVRVQPVQDSEKVEPIAVYL